MRRINSVFSFCEAIIAALFLYVLNNKRSFDAHFEFRSRRHYMKLSRPSNTQLCQEILAFKPAVHVPTNELPPGNGPTSFPFWLVLQCNVGHYDIFVFYNETNQCLTFQNRYLLDIKDKVYHNHMRPQCIILIENDGFWILVRMKNQVLK